MAHEEILQETKFNAGIDIALNLATLFKQGDFFSFKGEYVMYHNKLELAEVNMSPKFRNKPDAGKEVKDIKKNGMPAFKLYNRKMTYGKKVPQKLLEEVKIYLTEYHQSLLFWRDKFGYGMPQKDDITKAAWR